MICPNSTFNEYVIPKKKNIFLFLDFFVEQQPLLNRELWKPCYLCLETTFSHEINGRISSRKFHRGKSKFKKHEIEEEV